MARKRELLLWVGAALLAGVLLYGAYFAGRVSVLEEARAIYFGDMGRAADAQAEYHRAVEAEPGERPTREVFMGFREPRPTDAEAAVRDLGAFDGRHAVYEELEERQGPVYGFVRYLGGEPVERDGGQ